jgi:hypothetical protein
VAGEAEAVLRRFCYRCHGCNGVAEGGMNFILERQRLVDRRLVVPGKSAASRLYLRLQSRTDPMPPEGEEPRPSTQDRETLQRWIDAGAPEFRPYAAPAFLTPAQVLAVIRDDLQRAGERDRRYLRYFVLTHLHNAGISPEELKTYRQGISKLVNCLSWGRRIVLPQAIDPAGTVLRIDLRDLKWDQGLWDRIAVASPYHPDPIVAASEGISELAGTSIPHVRGDWFVAAASRPPLYHEILQLPETAAALERRLDVDISADIRLGRAVRAGFNGSGVSRNNRLIERHESSYGAYWRSYDFAANARQKNLFEHPLGPGGDRGFEPDGGEILFNLPNGLQAYLLVDGKGKRIDRGPTAIVSDPKQPDRAVVNGISCMSCHAQGVIAKTDQIRPHVTKNAAAFDGGVRDEVLALYAAPESLADLLHEDADRFRRAVNRALGKDGAHLDNRLPKYEPITAVGLLFEQELGAAQAAADAGLRPAELLACLDRSAKLARALGALRVEGGTVQRQAFAERFTDLVATAGRASARLPGGEIPAARGRLVPGLLAPDGRSIAWGTGPGRRSVRVWDASSGEEVGNFRGHTDVVYAVAFSPDSRSLPSAGWDRTVRLWNVEAGREHCVLRGHTDEVHTVAFSPDGKTLASGGQDGKLVLWDLQTGRERVVLDHSTGVTAVAFSPTGERVASAEVSGGLTLWDVATGRKHLALTGHRSCVNALAFSPDGQRLASAGDDRSVVLWDLRTGETLRKLTGHKGPVFSVAFSASGKRLASGSGEDDPSVKLWDAETGRLVRSLQSTAEIGCAAYVLGVAFGPEDRWLAAADARGTVILWDVHSGKEIRTLR